MTLHIKTLLSFLTYILMMSYWWLCSTRSKCHHWELTDFRMHTVGKLAHSFSKATYREQGVSMFQVDFKLIISIWKLFCKCQKHRYVLASNLHLPSVCNACVLSFLLMDSHHSKANKGLVTVVNCIICQQILNHLLS